MTKPVLFEYFDKKTKELHASYVLTSKQKASNNVGKNRENFIKKFLKVVLPPKLSVKSGEVWDKKGSQTGQLDALIIRNDAPSLDFGNENVYLAEGLLAVIEIKSNLTTEKLKEAAVTLKKIEELQVSKPTFRVGYHLPTSRPLRMVFAYDGATWNTLAKSIKDNNWEDLFDLICILKEGVFIKKGLLLNLINKKTGKRLSENYVLVSRPSALAILYYYLVQYGSSLSSGSIDLEDYFIPIAEWGDVKEV